MLLCCCKEINCQGVINMLPLGLRGYWFPSEYSVKHSLATWLTIEGEVGTLTLRFTKSHWTKSTTCSGPTNAPVRALPLLVNTREISNSRLFNMWGLLPQGPHLYCHVDTGSSEKQVAPGPFIFFIGSISSISLLPIHQWDERSANCPPECIALISMNLDADLI